MPIRRNRIPPAVRHGAYSATAVLPGESQADFDRLRRDLIAEWAPSGALEEDIVADMTRFVWRKQNLGTLRISELAQRLWSEAPANAEKIDRFKNYIQQKENTEKIGEKVVAMGRTLEALGDTFELVEIGDAATFDGLTKELDIIERLNALIEKCVKRLLLVRGLKSISAAPSSAAPKRISAPSKAA